MTISLLKCCIRNVLRKRSENVDFLKSVMFKEITSSFSLYCYEILSPNFVSNDPSWEHALRHFCLVLTLLLIVT